MHVCMYACMSEDVSMLRLYKYTYELSIYLLVLQSEGLEKPASLAPDPCCPKDKVQ